MLASTSNPLQHALNQTLSNPLITALPNRLTSTELAAAMQHRPITPKNVSELPLDQRPFLINAYKEIFAPTVQTLSIAHSMQRLLFDGLAARDPRQSTAKSFIYKAASLKGAPLNKCSWWPGYAAGMVVEGITGTGKSQAVDRYLQLLPQVIEHEHMPDCGWRSLKQLVYLKVHMPSDGSRGGFLTNGLLELDRMLGTDYFKQYQGRQWTTEKLLVIFLHILAVHRCGLLIIEEAQEKNLSQGPFGPDFMTFFLRVLNWGVPTVLVGNPKAFSKLKNFSQDMDRFSEGGWHTLIPHQDHTSNEWSQIWIPSLWTPTLLPDRDADYAPTQDFSEKNLAEFIWRRTAGFPRYLCRLRREVQEIALRQGLSSITPDLVDKVYRSSPKMIILHSRIEAFVNRDWKTLERFDDIPASYFRRLWAPVGDPGVAPAVAPAAPSGSAPKSSSSTTGAQPARKSSKPSRRKPPAKGAAEEAKAKLTEDITSASGH